MIYQKEESFGEINKKAKKCLLFKMVCAKIRSERFVSLSSCQQVCRSMRKPVVYINSLLGWHLKKACLGCGKEDLP